MSGATSPYLYPCIRGKGSGVWFGWIRDSMVYDSGVFFSDSLAELEMRILLAGNFLIFFPREKKWFMLTPFFFFLARE